MRALIDYLWAPSSGIKNGVHFFLTKLGFGSFLTEMVVIIGYSSKGHFCVHFTLLLSRSLLLCIHYKMSPTGCLTYCS